MTSFDYGLTKVKEIAVDSEVVKNKKNNHYHKVQSISINGEKLTPTKRFWTSIQTRFGFSDNFFRYFSHKEVFDRVSEKAPNDTIRYCIERKDDGSAGTLLAVTNPNSPVVKYEQVTDLLTTYEAKGYNYNSGIIRSTHIPRVGNNAIFKISGDEFRNQFVVDTPIDGFGKPNVYLSLFRLICANGAVGFSPTFRSEVSTGKSDVDILYSLVRVIDSFNNEDGFAAMRDRFISAANSWASVGEVQKLYKLLARLHGESGLLKLGREIAENNDIVGTSLPILHNFHKMTGDLSEKYGLANLDSLSPKMQRQLPAPCKVYDLLNFSSEVATHHSKPRGANRLQAYIGDLVSTEYDLEGTGDQFSDWTDFFVSDERAIKSKMVLDSRSGR